MTIPDREMPYIRLVKPHFSAGLNGFRLHTATGMANTMGKALDPTDHEQTTHL